MILPVHIRWMIRRDFPEVCEIEREAFEFPWSEQDFIDTLRKRDCIGMVAESDSCIVGYMIYELHAKHLHLLNIAVRGCLKRNRIGQQMIEKLVAKLSSQRRTRISLEVRERNYPAQVFFRANGFKATDVLHGFYDDSPEDAYLMQFVSDYENHELTNRISCADGVMQ